MKNILTMDGMYTSMIIPKLIGSKKQVFIKMMMNICTLMELTVTTTNGTFGKTTQHGTLLITTEMLTTQIQNHLEELHNQITKTSKDGICAVTTGVGIQKETHTIPTITEITDGTLMVKDGQKNGTMMNTEITLKVITKVLQKPSTGTEATKLSNLMEIMFISMPLMILSTILMLIVQTQFKLMPPVILISTIPTPTNTIPMMLQKDNGTHIK